ncbi:MAG: hypothetical protein ACWA5K_05710 [bacterium]
MLKDVLAGLNARKLASSVLLIVGLVFIGYLVGRSWEQIVELSVSVNWLQFVLSMLVGIAGTIASSMMFKVLLAKHGFDLASGAAHRLFFYGQVAKYVPGKIWAILYQIAAIDRQGASVGVASANLDLMLISVLVNLSMATAIILAPEYIYIAIVVALAGVLVTLWASGSRLTGRLLRAVLPKSYVQGYELTSPDWRSMFVGVFAYYVVVFVTSLLSYYLMMNAVFGFGLLDSATYMAYLVLAWVVGVFAFLVPAGLGVRELVFISFGVAMNGNIPIELLASIALISRVWQIAQDLLTAVAVLAGAAVDSVSRRYDSAL